MKFDKNIILKNLNAILCVICVVALLLPFCSVDASVSFAGVSGGASEAVNGITMVTETGMWGYLFVIALAGILLFSYIKQLSSYKKLASLVCSAVMILSLFLSPGNLSAAGGAEGSSSVEIDVSYGVGFWIILVCSVCFALLSLIGFLGLKGNPLFDAINSVNEETPKQDGERTNIPNINLSSATEKIGNVTKNITEAVSQQAGNIIDKAKETASNMQTSSAQKTPTDNTDYIMEQINKLFEMKEKGILTEEEFTAKKAEYLSKL